jgi:hypothetical protein
MLSYLQIKLIIGWKQGTGQARRLILIRNLSQNLISQSGLCCCMSSFDCVVCMVVWWMYVFCLLALGCRFVSC